MTEGIPDRLEGFWVDDLGDVWTLVSYCERPTMTLERVKDSARVGGAVGAPIFDRFEKLTRVT